MTEQSNTQQSSPEEPENKHVLTEHTESDTVEVADADDSDVEQALERDTQDGKGDEEPGDEDFDSFATEGVENQEN